MNLVTNEYVNIICRLLYGNRVCRRAAVRAVHGFRGFMRRIRNPRGGFMITAEFAPSYQTRTSVGPAPR